MKTNIKTPDTDCLVWKGALMEEDPFYTFLSDDTDNNDRFEQEKAYEEREAWLKLKQPLSFY